MKKPTAKDVTKKGLAPLLGQDLKRGEHVVGQTERLLLPPTSDTDFYAKKRAKEKELGHKLTTEDFQENHYEADGAGNTGTSIFDPVLCELVYRWFAPPKARILDPFAGGSVRGIVAAYLEHEYFGVDLSGRQLKENRKQTSVLSQGQTKPKWIEGDSKDILSLVCGEFDLVFSCPPYADLEVYSEDPRDVSVIAAKDYPAFVAAYRHIVASCVTLLKPDRFAAFVVGDIRGPDGFYRNFPAETIKAFQDAGAVLYNEAVLVTAVGSLPIRIGKQFGKNRKLGKTHQNLLVFFKGDPKAIARDFPTVEAALPAADALPL